MLSKSLINDRGYQSVVYCQPGEGDYRRQSRFG